MKNFKTFMEDKTLKDIAKKEKESMYNTGAEASKTVRIMQKQIKREKSDDVIIVKLSDDGDSVMRVEKDELKKYLKKGYEKLKESIMEASALFTSPITGGGTIKQVVSTLSKKLKAPSSDFDFKRAHVDTGMPTSGMTSDPEKNAEMELVMISFSLDSKKDWPSGKFKKSRWVNMNLYRDGILNMTKYSPEIKKPLGKIKVKSINDVISKINAWIKSEG
jgi:hypothetical protein